MVDNTKDGLEVTVQTNKRQRISLIVLIFIVIVVITVAAIQVGGDNKDDGEPDDDNERVTEVKPTDLSKRPMVNTTSAPTSVPTSFPTNVPTSVPTKSPIQLQDKFTNLTDITYRPGYLTVNENGLLLSQGLTSRLIAKAKEPVPYHNGTFSKEPFHERPDFGATFAVPSDFPENRGGWVYVSNSEMKEKGKGGVGAIMFDKNGNVIGYKKLLKGTTMNCGGGRTPWETFVSCEEVKNVGRVIQVDPFGRRNPQVMSMGRHGGRWESFAVDDRNRSKPFFYVTEDLKQGPTIRWTPDPSNIDWEDSPWEMMHGNGTLDYLMLDPSDNSKEYGTFKWTKDRTAARNNAEKYYPQSEGIDRKGNLLYIVCKAVRHLFILDLNSNTYKRSSTEFGLFDGQPDQVMRMVSRSDDILYYTEDGGSAAGVHGRNKLGQFFSILEGPGWTDETSGLAFDPSGMHMYVAFQNSGVLFDITREDGRPFYGLSLDVRYHNVDVDHLLI